VRAAGDGQPSFAVEGAEQRLAFQRAVFQKGHPVFAFKDDIGAGKGRVQVTVAHLETSQDVGLARDRRRARRKRVFHREGMRQHLVLYIDRGEPGPGSFIRLGHEKRYRCTYHPHGRANRRQQGFLLAIIAQAVLAGDVRCSEDGHDPRDPQRRTDIDGEDAGMVMRRTQDMAPQRAR